MKLATFLFIFTGILSLASGAAMFILSGIQGQEVLTTVAFIAMIALFGISGLFFLNLPKAHTNS